MPYRHAHYFVGFVLAVILAGFWASYWSIIGDVPIAFHVHAMSASCWLLLLIVQSIAIHRRANAFHKIMGQASFALFPFLILGFVMIIAVTANRFVAGNSPFVQHNGPSFAVGMAIAIVAYTTLYYQALKTRHNVKLHAGYMLATPLILFESPFSRVIEAFFPWMNFIGSEGPHQVQDMIAISDALVAIFALGLYSMDRKHGAPWLVAACFVTVQAVVMWCVPFLREVDPLLTAYAQVPLALTMFAGVAAGALTAWLGWRAGGVAKRPAMPSQA